jgi:hypothetical protein
VGRENGADDADQSPALESPCRVLLDAVDGAVQSGDLATTAAFGPEQIADTVCCSR